MAKVNLLTDEKDYPSKAIADNIVLTRRQKAVLEHFSLLSGMTSPGVINKMGWKLSYSVTHIPMFAQWD